jgi:tetratricopeptide (TPR) repeat protein
VSQRVLRATLLSVATLATAAACATSRPPAVAAAPKFPAYPAPDVPASLRVTREVRSRQDEAWRRLQAGDLRGAGRDFAVLLKQHPAFYPAEVGLGFVDLAGRDFKGATARFSAALARDSRYLPAWIGQAEAQIELNNDGQAIIAMERVLAIDPKREGVQSRLELLRFKQIQARIDEGRRARQAGRLDAAERALEDALALSPDSALILRELALVEARAGRVDEAEAHVRRSIQLDASDPDGHVALAQLLETRGRYRDAAAAFLRAAAIDPRAEWRAAAAALTEKADLAALPAEFGDLAAAPSITRAHVAAYLGIRLARLIETAPARPTTVASDVGRHWAAPWILPVTRAGVMNVYANHTFQPAAPVRRNDLAEIFARLLAIAGERRPAELAAWRAVRPRFPDLPATNVYYRAAAVVVSAGVMSVDGEGRFRATQPATGADLTKAVARLDQMSR